MRPFFIFLQNLALNEISSYPIEPMVGMGSSDVCTTFEVAQKKDAKPVGGRGISAFSEVFLLRVTIFALKWQ